MPWQSVGYLPLFLLAIATQTTVPIPLDAVIISMFSLGFDRVMVVLVATAGFAIGASVYYALGRYGLSLVPWIKKEKRNKSFIKARKLYRQYGQWMLLFSSMPFVGKYFPLLAGVMETKWLNFIVIYVVGKVLYYVLFIGVINSLK